MSYRSRVPLPQSLQLDMRPNTLWTVGHSNRALADFLALLAENNIETVADVRRFPGSRRHPHFGRDSLAAVLHEHGIAYAHFPALGGRRTARGTSWPCWISAAHLVRGRAISTRGLPSSGSWRATPPGEWPA